MRGIVLPWSRFRLVWDMVGFVLIAYTMVALPVQISFSLNDATPPAVWALEFCMDLFFMSDIALNFRTAFVRNSALVYERKAIARHYLTSWFAVDAASSVPFEMILLIVALASGDEAGSGESEDGDARLASLGALKVLKLL